MISEASADAIGVEAFNTLLAERAALQREDHSLNERLATLQHQLDWLKRQLFGAKSERGLLEVPAAQMSLGEGWSTGEDGPPPALAAR